MARRIGFIGLGIMGSAMARNLLKAGHSVTVYNRTAAKCEALRQAGAAVAGTPTEAALGNDVVISIVNDSPDVEEVLLGPQGAVHGSRPGAVFIDMTTCSPEAARSIAGRLKQKQIDFLDAPVTGGDVGAQKGTLSIMVGGDEKVLEKVRDVLGAMGTRVTPVGPSGSGQMVKAVNQLIGAINMMAVAEGLTFAKACGLDLAKVHQVITGGASNSFALEQLGARILKDDYAPGFMVRLMLKDRRIVMEAAERAKVPLAGARQAQAYLQSNLTHGEGELGTQVMYRTLEKMAGLNPKAQIPNPK